MVPEGRTDCLSDWMKENHPSVRVIGEFLRKGILWYFIKKVLFLSEVDVKENLNDFHIGTI